MMSVQHNVTARGFKGPYIHFFNNKCLSQLDVVMDLGMLLSLTLQSQFLEPNRVACTVHKTTA